MTTDEDAPRDRAGRTPEDGTFDRVVAEHEGGVLRAFADYCDVLSATATGTPRERLQSRGVLLGTAHVARRTAAAIAEGGLPLAKLVQLAATSAGGQIDDR